MTLNSSACAAKLVGTERALLTVALNYSIQLLSFAYWRLAWNLQQDRTVNRSIHERIHHVAPKTTNCGKLSRHA
jgi:hypothetical protein